jgi:hypothetical protein
MLEGRDIMTDPITLLATATDDRLHRFCGLASVFTDFIEQRKQTAVYWTLAANLPAVIQIAMACAVTLQQVHDPGRGERYETLHQGPMEGWGNHARV